MNVNLKVGASALCTLHKIKMTEIFRARDMGMENLRGFVVYSFGPSRFYSTTSRQKRDV